MTKSRLIPGAVLSVMRDGVALAFFAVPTMFAVFAALALLAVPAQAQNFRPEYNELYDDTRVATIRITIDPALLDSILAPGNEESDVEHPASFEYDDGTTVETVEQVGFRLRGNTSRYSAKKSYKVSFNTFVKGQKFKDVEKLNLNGEHNDPSIVRSKLAWDLFQEYGVAASREAHVRLYINDAYFGLYANVEHIDEQFLQSRFGDDSGNLYKCLYPADLSYLGPTADSYRPTDPDRRPYDLKLKDSDLEGYDDLAEFIDVLNNTSDALFVDEITRVFDVNGFLRALAVDIVTGSWDDYWYLQNNYYLYSNPRTGLFEYIPYDFDNTFGIWWDGIESGLDWGTRNIYNWGSQSQPRPLTDRILAVPSFVNRLTYFVQELLATSYIPADLSTRIDELHTLITPAAEQDTFRTLDYGWTISDFHDSYTQALGAHVTYGLKPFIETRYSSALSQLSPGFIRPVILDAYYEPLAPSSAEPVQFFATVLDDAEGLTAVLEYTINGETNTLPMHDDGMGPDKSAGDGIYSVELPPTEETVTMTYRFGATDATDRSSFSNMRTVQIGYTGLPLFINELMASNDTTVADAFGDFDDWVEVYNGGTDPINLSGLYFSDNLSNPDKWAAPDTVIAPGTFVMLWLDDEEDQGPLHLPFKLSAGGEQFGIFNSDEEIIDAVTFGEQETDIAYGRTVDGAGRFEYLDRATPAGSNGTGTGTVTEPTRPVANSIQLEAFPNPFNDGITVRVHNQNREGVRLEIYDVLGRFVAGRDVPLTSRADVRWNGRAASGAAVGAGLYLLRLVDSSGQVVASRSAIRQ